MTFYFKMKIRSNVLGFWSDLIYKMSFFFHYYFYATYKEKEKILLVIPTDFPRHVSAVNMQAITV